MFKHAEEWNNQFPGEPLQTNRGGLLQTSVSKQSTKQDIKSSWRELLGPHYSPNRHSESSWLPEKENQPQTFLNTSFLLAVTSY